MTEKKLQENTMPEEQKVDLEKSKDTATKSLEKPSGPNPVMTANLPARVSIPAFTKASPNDLYRRWLPAALFLLTFVTVMTILLIYMDTVALGAQQFRVNMSRDYELARVAQDAAPLVALVRQLHLAPRAARAEPPPPPPDRVPVLDRLLGEKHEGSFVEWAAAGARGPTVRFLAGARRWRGLAVRAAPRDFLALRGAALHACLSRTAHPREVSYQEPEGRSLSFVSRVLCLPLYTVLLAGELTAADYSVLAGPVPEALQHLPFDKVNLKVIEFQSTDESARNKTTEILLRHNYYIAATFPDGIMYALNNTAQSAPVAT